MTTSDLRQNIKFLREFDSVGELSGKDLIFAAIEMEKVFYLEQIDTKLSFLSELEDNNVKLAEIAVEIRKK